MIKSIVLLLSLVLPIQEAVTIHQGSDYITSDPLGNVYCITGTNLLRFNSEGKKMGEYTNNQLGAISSVDASDPLRILLYYRDFNQVLFLNKQLTELGSAINLYQFSPNEIQLVCSARQGGFWLYDPEEGQALHISSQGRMITRSIILNSFFEETQPTQMVEKGEHLYLLLPGAGVLVLTEMGKYRQMLHIPGIESMQFTSKGMLYTKESKLYRFSTEQQSDPNLFPEHHFESQHTRMEEGVLFFGDKKSIHIKELKH